MPNWCSNFLVVAGPETDLNTFIENAKCDNGIFSFNSLYPYPNGQWDYDWCVENWGTKWDINDNDTREVYLTKNCWKIKFDTAWAPPSEFFNKVSEDYPTLFFTLIYSEPGMDFSGVETWNQPDMTVDNEIYNEAIYTFTSIASIVTDWISSQ